MNAPPSPRPQGSNGILWRAIIAGQTMTGNSGSVTTSCNGNASPCRHGQPHLSRPNQARLMDDTDLLTAVRVRRELRPKLPDIDDGTDELVGEGDAYACVKGQR